MQEFCIMYTTGGQTSRLCMCFANGRMFLWEKYPKCPYCYLVFQFLCIKVPEMFDILPLKMYNDLYLFEIASL